MRSSAAVFAGIVSLSIASALLSSPAFARDDVNCGWCQFTCGTNAVETVPDIHGDRAITTWRCQPSCPGVAETGCSTASLRHSKEASDDLRNALRLNDARLVAVALERSRGALVLNVERNAIQLLGCDGKGVAAHYPLPKTGALAAVTIAKAAGVNPWLWARLGAPSSLGDYVGPRAVAIDVATFGAF